MNQPLDLLVKLRTVSFVYHTVRYARAEKSDWTKLSLDQRNLMRWLDGSTG